MIPVERVLSALVAVSGGGRDVCQGGCLPGGVCPFPLWTEWLTDRCKNITLRNFVPEGNKTRIIWVTVNDCELVPDQEPWRSCFHAVLVKFLPNNRLAQPLWETLDAPLQ